MQSEQQVLALCGERRLRLIRNHHGAIMLQVSSNSALTMWEDLEDGRFSRWIPWILELAALGAAEYQSQGKKAKGIRGKSKPRSKGKEPEVSKAPVPDVPQAVAPTPSLSPSSPVSAAATVSRAKRRRPSGA